MTFSDFNLYCKGYKEVLYSRQVDLMALAYNSGMFSHESKHKPKSLEHYINQIDKQFHKHDYSKVKVDVDKSRGIESKINKLKEMK